MEISISEQALEFLLSCLLGAGLGVLYDVFRILRAAFAHGRFLALLEDLIFWCLSAVITFFFLLLFSEGQVRLYILLGELLGFVVYYFTVGCLVIGMSKRIIRLVKCILRFFYRLLIYPFVRLFSFVLQKIKSAAVRLIKSFKKIGQIRKKHLQNEGDLVYNQNSTIDNADGVPDLRTGAGFRKRNKKLPKKERIKWPRGKREKI